MRKIAILAEGLFGWGNAKTAIGVIRYGQDSVVAVIDSTKAGKNVAQFLEAFVGNTNWRGIPIVRDINEALAYQPDALLLGIAPRGGLLPSEWRWQLLTDVNAGVDIINGLHVFLSDDEELHRAAARQPDVSYVTPQRPSATYVIQYSNSRNRRTEFSQQLSRSYGGEHPQLVGGPLLKRHR